MAVELVTVVDRVRDTVGDGVIYSHSCKVKGAVGRGVISHSSRVRGGVSGCGISHSCRV